MKQCLTTVLLCTAVSFNVLAGDRVAGEAKAALCTSCHGPAGNSVNPEWPKLAGQHAKYTAKQIHDFKAGATRSDALMAPMIAGLSDQDIEDIAAYYSVQPSTGGFTSEELRALGERVYRGGNMASGVPASIACHGPRGAGNGPAGFPRLALPVRRVAVEELRALERILAEEPVRAAVDELDGVVAIELAERPRVAVDADVVQRRRLAPHDRAPTEMGLDVGVLLPNILPIVTRRS